MVPQTETLATQDWWPEFHLPNPSKKMNVEPSFVIPVFRNGEMGRGDRRADQKLTSQWCRCGCSVVKTRETLPQQDGGAELTPRSYPLTSIRIRACADLCLCSLFTFPSPFFSLCPPHTLVNIFKRRLISVISELLYLLCSICCEWAPNDYIFPYI